MGTREDVVEHANYYRDTPSLCVVELADDTFVVTNTVEQAETLRLHLNDLQLAAKAAEPAKRVSRKQA